MKKKIIVFFIVFLFLIVSLRYKDNNLITEPLLEEDTLKVNVEYNDEVLNMELNDYIIGVLACEIPASFEIESLKALSVSIRSYTLYKLNTNDNYVLKNNDQCYQDIDKMKSKWKEDYEKYYNKLKQAVESTNNEIMTYNDEPILAFYFSTSNGKTENVENVFSQKLDYLVSVDSSWDKQVSGYKKTIEYDIEEFNKIFNINKIEKINIERYDSNRVKTIQINDKVLKGTEFRNKLSLRSADFDIEIKDKIYITTYGYGHGVGLSQYGSQMMAKEGYSYKDILNHYYTNVKIVNNYL